MVYAITAKRRSDMYTESSINRFFSLVGKLVSLNQFDNMHTFRNFFNKRGKTCQLHAKTYYDSVAMGDEHNIDLLSYDQAEGFVSWRGASVFENSKNGSWSIVKSGLFLKILSAQVTLFQPNASSGFEPESELDIWCEYSYFFSRPHTGKCLTWYAELRHSSHSVTKVTC